MNLAIQTEIASLGKNKNIDFIDLNGKSLAEYNIIYHINDCYSIQNLTQFNHKNQLLFQKFESKSQQLNLLLVDTIFPIILADLALDVFIKNVYNFNDYIQTNKTIAVIESKNSKNYLKYKFYNFLDFLLYSTSSLNNILNKEQKLNRFYSLKNNDGLIGLFSVYEKNELLKLLLDSIKLQIDIDLSTISKSEVSLCLKIGVP